MSIKFMTWAFEQEMESPTQKLVLLSLADHADSFGQCFPSLDLIAKRAGVSRRSVLRHLSEMEERGILVRHKRTRADGSQASSLYQILTSPPGSVEPNPEEVPAPPRGGGDSVAPPYDTGDTGGGDSVAPLGDTSGTPGVSPASPLEPSVEPSLEQTALVTHEVRDLFEEAGTNGNGRKKPSTPPPQRRVTIEQVGTPGFDYQGHPRYQEFSRAWVAYPARTTRESRRAAFVAWLKLVERKGVDPGDIYEAVVRYGEECKEEDQDPRYVKRFASFVGPGNHSSPGYPYEAFLEGYVET